MKKHQFWYILLFGIFEIKNSETNTLSKNYFFRLYLWSKFEFKILQTIIIIHISPIMSLIRKWGTSSRWSSSLYCQGGILTRWPWEEAPLFNRWQRSKIIKIIFLRPFDGSMMKPNYRWIFKSIFSIRARMFFSRF